MATADFDCSGIDQALLSGSRTVTSDHMGSIYTTFLTLENYDKAISPADVGGIRWPGGMVAEAQPEKYNLTFPDIFITDFREDRGLTDVLVYANANDLSFAMILPTMPYMNDVEQGVADVEQFVKRLVAGEFGALTEDFTLEIGNESSHVGWVNGQFTPGVGSYGYIANEYLTAINKVLSDPALNPDGIEVKVAVQMSTTVGGQRSIFSQITPENLVTVDGFVRHSGLVMTADAFDVGFENAKVDAAFNWWDLAWDGQAPDMYIMDSAWAVGPSDPIPTDGSVEPGTYDIGTRHAAAVVETFSKLMAAGSDSASIWGVQNNPSSMFYYSGEKITYGGHAFRLMADSLVGTTLVDGKLNASGDWVESGLDWDSIVYADNAKAVIFVSAGDIAEGGLEVSINLTGLGNIQYAWAEVISSSVPLDPQQVVVGGTGVAGSPVISRMLVSGDSNTVTVRLANDYEVIRIIAAQENPQLGYLHLWGTAANDDFQGGSSDDLLEGNAGNDILRGGLGNDTLLGGSGDDTYFVDSASDRVFETTTSTSTVDAGGIDTVKSSVTVNLDVSVAVRFVENLTLTGTTGIHGSGNALDNKLTGNSSHNILNGGAGNDTMSGWAGNDSLNGGVGQDLMYGDAGNDVLTGGTGNDTAIGGAGNDTYVVDAAGDEVFETTTQNGTIDAGGVDIVQSSVSFNLDATVGVRFVENLTLTGTASIDATGNALDNQLTGNDGDNALIGGSGNDMLRGMMGNDMLSGGAGRDTFVFNTALAAGNIDQISDFNVADDSILLNSWIFSLSMGTLSAGSFAANAQGLAVTATERIIYETDTGRLSYDSDGVGGAAQVQFAVLTAGLQLSNADFIAF